MSHTGDYLGIHLTGSLPFDRTNEAFAFIGESLKPWVRRVPDGEPGDRANWVLTQSAHFFENPAFEPAPPAPDINRPLVRIKDGSVGRSIDFRPFAYADDAGQSYSLFQEARRSGVLAPESKFLISLPTPLNALFFFVDFKDRAAVLPAYTAQAKATVEDILARIPHEDLAVQWDLPIELATVQGWFPNPLGAEVEIYSAIAEISAWFPSDVDFGYHLCYGDPKFGPSPFMGREDQRTAEHHDHGRHIIPPDISVVVKVSNALAQAVKRPINFVHAATMRSWTEPRHWETLEHLRLKPETEFYLGLVHADDTPAEARYRLDIAARHLSAFGISTECGLGRYSRAQLASVVSTFRALNAEIASSHARVA